MQFLVLTIGREIGIFNGRKVSFLKAVLFLSILLYYSGLYFVSFQSHWWSKLGDSLSRSSIFMVPIAGYVMLSFLVRGGNGKN